MIEVMKGIMYDDDKIKVQYNELIKFVQAESEKELNFFEGIINEIMSGRGSPHLKNKLEESRNRIFEMERIFQEFEGLHIAKASKTDEII
jgi:hypothetical protein